MNGMNQCRKWLLNVVTFTVLLVNFALTASAQQGAGNEDIFFETLFKQYPGKFDSVLLHRKAWNVQIIYTQINRGNNGIPSFLHYYFNKKSARYFYPASTVKLPVALLALQKMHALGRPDISINSTMITEAAYSGQTPVYNDPNTPDGRPTIAQYIKEMLLVSDNNAYNRLYEFMGQKATNDILNEKGYNVRFLHRLERALSPDQNRHTEKVRFVKDNSIVFEQPMLVNEDSIKAPAVALRGMGYYKNDPILVQQPFDFTYKNFYSLADQQKILRTVLFPESVDSINRFNLTDEDYKFLYQYMSQLPAETTNPAYYKDPYYYDAYCKFLIYGKSKERIPDHIRIFNKVGDAYGYLLDNAYVVDFKNGVEFMLSAVVNVNTDGVYNDGKYDYETIGYPFFRNLGQLIYTYELERPRSYKPDLSQFQLEYDRVRP